MHNNTIEPRIVTRSAVLPDAPTIHGIISLYAREGLLLPRTLPELNENIRDFVVAFKEERIVGCGALHLYGPHLAEIRSIAVSPDSKSRGVGRALVKTLLTESSRHQVRCVCLFTRTPGFFAHLGFEVARREELPAKIYKDCVSCPKLSDCDEIAMVMGQLPKDANGLRDPQIRIPRVPRKH